MGGVERNCPDRSFLFYDKNDILTSMRKLTIVQIAPIDEALPPPKYGAVELVVYNLTEELIERGHRVYLLAAGNSKTTAELLPIISRNLRTSLGTANPRRLEVAKFLALSKIIQILNTLKRVDIIHNHFNWRILGFSELIKKPIVTTLHGQLNDENLKIAHQNFTEANYVSISNHQRLGFRELNFLSTVYNGINLNKFRFSKKGGKYLAFLGRMSPEKGPDQAIKIGVSAGVPVKMAAKVDTVQQKFFEAKIMPSLNNQIKFIGEVNESQKNLFLGNAFALIAPIQTEEAFGLAFVEAMACGTPVIAFARGSVPEIIKDGETGLIINHSREDQRGEWIIKKVGHKGMIEAVKRIQKMSNKEYEIMRFKCRRHVEQNFTVDKMVTGYENVYQQLVARHN